MNLFDDYEGEMPADEMESFVAGVRAAATRMPEPSPTLAHLLMTGLSSPEPKRSIFMKAKTYVAGLGLAAKVMLGAGVAAAATTGAGAAGVLPGPAQHVFAATVDSVTPFTVHDPDKNDSVATADHNGDNQNPGDDHHGDTPDTPTTIGDNPSHEGDNGGVVGVPVTTTTAPPRTEDHHGEHHDAPATTTTTVAEHHEPTTTSTTVEHHDGDNNNPESLSITCTAAHEPNSITCHWTASTNPDHVKYALLRINNQNTEGRVMTTTENGLEFTDTTVNPGWGYGYRVVSLRADGSTESHSNIFTIPCC
ncbi:MAG TPA: hypothetical protein VHD87_04515 [Acidimicrobiales bacterium]|nr:hypothetical protein [Acidimicrobiales bacterium]